ncbi:MAG TPA: porin family protein [Chitinophagaceae bacterium]|nr:porin family protein [Chitinophagaceae bacterium]
MKSIISTLLALFCTAGIAFGQANAPINSKSENFFNKNMDYELQAFFSIGGSSPLGFPREIREIKSYNPSLQLGLEANATKWLDPKQKWGIRVGVSIEGKGMETEAGVENYFTEIIQDNSGVQGYFTGTVKTDVKNVFVTVPISAVYNISDHWNLLAGLFVSYLIDEQFDGYVSDGYFRPGAPTSPKVTFSGDSKAAYDFSDDERSFQWGAQIGAERIIGKHLAVMGNLSYGINDIFKKDFNSITFNMHNIYVDLGFSYRF